MAACSNDAVAVIQAGNAKEHSMYIGGGALLLIILLLVFVF
jgi:hypothetical protein